MDLLQGYLYEGIMIGKRIRLGRTTKGLTLREIGEVMGVTPQAVAQWERSSPQFDEEKSAKLGALLGADVDWLNGKIGDDATVLLDEGVRYFDTRVPLCSLKQAIKYRYIRSGVFDNNKHTDFSNNVQIEPSHRIVGQATAILIDIDIDELEFKKMDIAIFDDGVKTQIGDTVLCFVFIDNNIVAVYGKFVKDLESDHDSDGRLVLYGCMEHDVRQLDLTEDNMGIAGVLVELRRLRPPGIMIDKRPNTGP